uniref:DEAD/DEAH box helicase family protein n=1 Tax=Thioalkalivibrio sp. ALE23 TaxID=1265495 RepID=UPI000477B1FD
MKVRIKFLPSLLGDVAGSSVSPFFRDQLHAAAETGIRKSLPPIGTQSESINLTARDFAAFSGFREGDEPWAQVLSELLHGHLETLEAESLPSGDETAATDPAKDWMRPEQRRYYEGLSSGLTDGKIVIAEASTGVGKGRAIAQAIEDALSGGRERVVVCAPTLGVLAALAEEFSRAPTLNRSMQFALGAAQFFHAGRAGQMAQLMQSSEAPEIRESGEKLAAWLEQGAPPGQTSATQSFAKVGGVPVSHLSEDLARFLPEGFTADELVLSSDEVEENDNGLMDPGVAAALAARDLETEAPIVFCTHAMYALHGRFMALERFLLPPHDVLIIDEAHQFEQNASSVLSPSASLDQLPRLAKRLPEPVLKDCPRALEDIESGLKALRGRFPEKGGERLLLADDEGYAAVQGEAGRLHEALDTLIGRAERSRTHAPEPGLLALLKRTRSVLGGATGKRVMLQVSSSPVRGYLSLASGAHGLKRLLDRIWPQLDAAALVSATLYVPTRDSRRADVSDGATWYSAKHLSRVLSLPEDRRRCLPPIRPQWVRDNVIAHLTRDAEDRPPTSNGEDSESYRVAMESWLDRMASHIESIAERASMGTLVLLTSYSDIQGLYRRLNGTP